MEIIIMGSDPANSEKDALTDLEAKDFLSDYGISFIPQVYVVNLSEVVSAARKSGFPVVLKGVGKNLLHKSDRGLVHLNLSDAEAVATAAKEIAAEVSGELDGFLIQPHIEGRREFVVGLFQDHQFGPVVMFGTGGVFTEAFSDVTFRLAPLTESDAIEMLDEIQGKALLGRFRGEAAVKRDELVHSLLSLSRIGENHPEIAEIDINPLLVTSEGSAMAVDALVVRAPESQKSEVLPPVSPDAIGSLFYPKSIAIVGASAQIGKWGHSILTNTISGGFEGGIYPVNPAGGQIAGKTVYRSIAEIPDKIDLAVVTIPAEKVLDLVPQFQTKKVRNMVLITSGFGETGEYGKQMEKDLVKAAH